jgi:hypothetical protein
VDRELIGGYEFWFKATVSGRWTSELENGISSERQAHFLRYAMECGGILAQAEGPECCETAGANPTIPNYNASVVNFFITPRLA